MKIFNFADQDFKDNKQKDIAITPGSDRYLLSGKEQILMYDSQGKRLKNSLRHRFISRFKGIFNERPFATIEAVDNEPANSVTLNVDMQGRIIAGLDTTTISVYRANGSLKNKFTTKAIPQNLDVITTSSKKKIAVVFIDHTLQIMDYDGTHVRDIEPPEGVDQMGWCPSSVCCSIKDEIFVVNHCDGDNAVYQYGADGDKYQCIGRIISGLNDPWGIATTPKGDKLYITERSQNRVKIFQKPTS